MPRPITPEKKTFFSRTRLGLWLRVSVWVIGAAGLAYAGKEANAFLMHDPRFELACEPQTPNCVALEIRGAVYANRARLQSVFTEDLGTSVFHIPLAERRRHLLAIDWVSSATISRVWPNRIVVTVTERRPVAFAKLPMGVNRYRFALVDSEGVLLSLPPRVRFRLPVASGITEEQPEAERRRHVLAMQHLLDDLGPQAADISEVNTTATEDMRVITQIDGRAVELWIGDQHYRSRYQHFLSNYAEIKRHTPGSSIFDLRMDDRITAR
jgi:cell division protein FtsQ